MAFFGVRLSDDFAARFDAFASGRGGRSGLLRRLMEDALRAGGADTAEALPPQPRGRSEKLTLRLKPDEQAALDKVSSEAGMKRTEWALASLRARLLGRPQFNAVQAQALLETRQELVRISTNLRELVRLVRDGDIDPESVASELAKLEAFRGEVRGELDSIRSAIDGAAAYWEAA